MEVENDLDQRARNVVVNAYEAKHAGSIEEGEEGEEEKRAKVAADLGECFWRRLCFLICGGWGQVAGASDVLAPPLRRFLCPPYGLKI